MTEPPTGPPPPAQMPPPGPDPERTPPPVSIGLLVLGLLTVVPMSFFLVFAVEGMATGLRAGLFAGLVFVGGGALCFVRSPQARGFGIGLMVGWALLSITTGGVCTALQEFTL